MLGLEPDVVDHPPAPVGLDPEGVGVGVAGTGHGQRYPPGASPHSVPCWAVAELLTPEVCAWMMSTPGSRCTH